MNISDMSTSKYLVANDFDVGTEFPLLPIKEILSEEVPIPNSTKKQRMAVIYFVGGSKGWAANATRLREIGLVLGTTKGIEKKWIGARVALKVVGDVRRPNGEKGNAIRVARVELPMHVVSDGGKNDI